MTGKPGSAHELTVEEMRSIVLRLANIEAMLSELLGRRKAEVRAKVRRAAVTQMRIREQILAKCPPTEDERAAARKYLAQQRR